MHSTVRFLFGKQKRMTFTPLERQSISFEKMGVSRIKAKIGDFMRARCAAPPASAMIRSFAAEFWT